jgi:hypothetical protein
MDIDRLSREFGLGRTRRGFAVALMAAIAASGSAFARRPGGPGAGLVDFDECLERIGNDICRGLKFYDRRTCERAASRCCKAKQLTMQNATRCVEGSLPRRP